MRGDALENSRERERQREKETDGLYTTPRSTKSANCFSSRGRPADGESKKEKGRVCIGKEMHSSTFNIYSHPLCRVRGNRIFTISDYAPKN